MDMKTTENGTRKFTHGEKLAILKEAKQKGVKATLAKYDLYPATYYYWKKKHLVYGEEGLHHAKQRDQETRMKSLEKENEQLKILLAEKELESKLKDELLKKRYPELRKRF
jgi:putative transposase